MGLPNKAWAGLHSKLMGMIDPVLSFGGCNAIAFPTLPEHPIKVIVEVLAEHNARTCHGTEQLLRRLIDGERPPSCDSITAYFAGCRIVHAVLLLEKITDVDGEDYCPFPEQTAALDEDRMTEWLLFTAWYSGLHETMVTIAYRFATNGPTLYL